jgi:hypothetical protein
MGNMEIIELKELGFEAEVEIIDTKILKTNEEIDLQLSIGKPEKEGDLFIGCSKVNARKKLFCCNDGE